MWPPRHVLHFGPASKPSNVSVGTSQGKGQAAGEKMIILWEYLRRAAEKSACQGEECSGAAITLLGLKTGDPSTWYWSATPHFLSVLPARSPCTSSARINPALCLHHSFSARLPTPCHLKIIPPT
ncbi:hypothetical protein XENOCAPTIV_020217 [Xenoophorus captivus]|uniref:Uncharacterized protein n=1 Tax=Xenoophorus captivus TaxID=1517983 RepID=A0ABV0R9U2_9TELE